MYQEPKDKGPLHKPDRYKLKYRTLEFMTKCSFCGHYMEDDDPTIERVYLQDTVTKKTRVFCSPVCARQFSSLSKSQFEVRP